MITDMGICPWLYVAQLDLGLKEIPGKATAPRIERMLRALRAWWSDDETPWCGVAVATWMREGGVDLIPQHWYRARAWLDWGQKLDKPVRGCVAILERGGAGHVALVTGVDLQGRVLLLGGNQGNAVSINAFDASRVLGYRWPDGLRIPTDPLPPTAMSATLSKGEA